MRSGSNTHLIWKDRSVLKQFRTAVSLHSHTSQSEESLDMIPRYTGKIPYLGKAIIRQQQKYHDNMGHPLDFARAFWRPPLTPREALRLEIGQIERELGLEALVSLSDHDNIQAGVMLGMFAKDKPQPISVEWTIPFGSTFFHMGVHNLPPRDAGDIMKELAAFTANPEPEDLGGLLAMLNNFPETLLILNHPMWDEKGIGASKHAQTLGRLLERHGHQMHALELNGLRSWEENSQVTWLGRDASLPVISGGDRHGYEPNAILNLTNAVSWPEFVDEIRNDKKSEILFMSQYREPLKMRIVQTMWDVVKEYPEHPEGGHTWADRVFFRDQQDAIKPISEIWGDGGPSVVRHFVMTMRLVENPSFRSALRFALAAKQEACL